MKKLTRVITRVITVPAVVIASPAVRMLSLLGMGSALLFVFSLTGTSVAAPSPKVDVCHLDDTGTYHLINVSENAFAAHVTHGDGQVGSPVPGSGSFTGQGLFTSIGGNAEITIAGVGAGATFAADCGPTGPASGMLEFDRRAIGSNQWESVIVDNGFFSITTTTATFTVRVISAVGPNLVGCDLDWTITSDGGMGADFWTVTNIVDSTGGPGCAFKGENNNGVSVTGTFTIVPATI